MQKLLITSCGCGFFCLRTPSITKQSGRFRIKKGIDDTLAFLSVNIFILLLVIVISCMTKDALAQTLTPGFPPKLQKNLSSLPLDGRVIVRPEDGTTSYLRGGNLSSILEEDRDFRAIQSLDDPATVAIAFLNAYKDLFGILNPKDEFVLKSVNQDSLGYSHVRLRQVYSGFPIWNAEILIQLNQGNHISLVQADYIKTPLKLETQAIFSKKQVLKNIAKIFEIDSQCQDCKLKTIIYLTQKRKPLLAYQVSVTVSLAEGWKVIVDAHTGLVINKIPSVYSRSSGKL